MQDGDRAAQTRLAAAQRALKAQPDDPDRIAAMADVLEDLGRLEAALICRRKLVALSRVALPLVALPGGDPVTALTEVSRLAGRLGRWQLAAETARAALDRMPGDPAAPATGIRATAALAHVRYATARLYLGDATGAAEGYRRAEVIAADPAQARDFGSNRLLALAYRDDLDLATVAAAHQAWAARHHAAPALAPRPILDLDRRPLRIGYLSGDLRDHAVAHFIEPVLRGHAADRTWRVAYPTDPRCNPRQDPVAARLAGLVSGWRPVHGLSDAAAAARIRDDGIDVLIDLSGHTAGNRLGVLAHRAAPVQASWIGYITTTGLPTVDLRISDAGLTPPGTAEVFVEDLLILPRPSLAYRPPAIAPAPGPVPSLQGLPPTFGSFNNVAKLSAGCLDGWAGILARVPGSRLVLKSSAPIDDGAATRIRRHFGDSGVTADRVIILARVAEEADHLAAYGSIDVALDPFPYNGTTTTCEALHMGVPVITLRGDRTAARTGALLLEAAGQPDLVASTRTDYVDRAVAMIADGDRLAALRQSLRRGLATGPLGDGAGLARALESGLRSWIACHRSK